jgi:hypothetical protein
MHNKLLSIFANLPIGIPYAMGFKVHFSGRDYLNIYRFNLLL